MVELLLVFATTANQYSPGIWIFTGVENVIAFAPVPVAAIVPASTNICTGAPL